MTRPLGKITGISINEKGAVLTIQFAAGGGTHYLPVSVEDAISYAGIIGQEVEAVFIRPQKPPPADGLPP